jgi:hypothetical protein
MGDGRWVEFVDDLEGAVAWVCAGGIALLLLLTLLAVIALVLVGPIWLLLRVLAWLSGV